MSKTLRTYQTEARDAVIQSVIGQVILPTGTGKSTIQASVLETLITEKKGFGVYVILTPRILLTNQLMSSVAKDLLDAGVSNLKALTVHSGNTATLFDEDEVTEEERAIFNGLENKVSTNIDDVKIEIMTAKFHNRPILVCCTYDSAPVLTRAITETKVSIDQTLCDEAHYIVEKTFNSNVAALKHLSERIHYFTATRKLTPSTKCGLGMENASMYGDVIYRKTPREMIESGFMVQPRIHSVLAGVDTSYHAITAQAFEKHSGMVVVDAKMLVCCNGTKTVEEIRNNKHFIAWAAANDVTVFSVTSKHGEWRDNVRYKKRDDLLDELRGHVGKAIVLHVSILTEGIDVPNMSGVLFFRDMATCRFLQSLGRVTRALASDYGKDIDKRDKQFAYAIVVDREGDAESTDQYENLTGMVRKMREADFDAYENVYQDIDFGTDTGVEFDEAGSVDRRVKAVKNVNDLVDHQIEDERIANILADPNSTDDEWAIGLFA
jgi:superfamily II DNA or RNA helicase